MQASTHFVTAFPQPAPSSSARTRFPRYGVWLANGDARAEIVATGDNLPELCRFYGLDPDLVRLAVPDRADQGND